jgi:hypothetical protein
VARKTRMAAVKVFTRTVPIPGLGCRRIVSRSGVFLSGNVKG